MKSFVIDILGHPYKMSEAEANGKTDDEIKPDEMGKANLLGGQILVDQGLTKDAKAETLQHEVIECINFWGNIELTHHQITLLSVLLYDVWAKNPEVVRYILSSLKRGKKNEGD
jgi:hypothetical protein